MKQEKMERLTCARIPTDVGQFKLCLFESHSDGKEHMALVMGQVAEQERVLVRVHSECFTGDVLGSRRCDCGEQLNRAMQLVAEEGCGIIVYLRQEGRGIGLLNKLRAYNLQDEGYDTVEANLMLGHQADERDYTAAAVILRSLGVRSLRLITNNPTKIESLRELGINVVDRVPLQPKITADNADYLVAKVQRMRHLLDLNGWANGNGHHVLPAKDVNPLWQRSPQNHRPLPRPFITLSFAQSLDGSITARRGQPTALSGPESMAMTHQLRADNDAILVGIGTVLADDPSLTVRLVNGRDPQPIILDSHLRFPLNAKMLNNPRRPWIAATTAVDPKRLEKFAAAGIQVLTIPPNEQGQVDLTALLAELYQRGIERLMVEGGASVITGFLSAQLVDYIALTIAPVFVGGLKAVNTLIQSGGAGFPRLANLRYEQMGDDLVLSGDVMWAEEKAEGRKQGAEGRRGMRRAASLYFVEPYKVEVRESNLPQPGSGQVLVQTLVSAVSPGTEMLLYRGQMPEDTAVDETIEALGSTTFRYPLKYGYAAVGRVIALGEGVNPDWGNRLIFAFNPHETHFVARPEQLLPVPEGMTPETAVFLPNMETAVSFVMDSRPMIGEQVAVFGQGIVGLLTTALLARMPLASLLTVDRYALRREWSTRLGATAVLDSTTEITEFKQALQGERPYNGADLSFELSGNPAALDQAIAVTGYNGRILVGSWYGQKRADLHLGGHFHRSQMQIISSQVSHIAPRWNGRWTKWRRLQMAWQMLAQIQPGQFITHHFPLAQAAQAYQLLDQTPHQAVQVVLIYD